MPLVLTYECPKCGKEQKELHAGLHKHTSCEKVKVGTKPLMVLKTIDVNG